jgi:hypothetical protein
VECDAKKGREGKKEKEEEKGKVEYKLYTKRTRDRANTWSRLQCYGYSAT